MKCKSIEKKLIFYLEGDLSDSEKQTIMHHIEDCTDCSAKLDYLRMSLQYIKEDVASEIKPYLFTRIKARQQSNKHGIYRWGIASMAATLVLFIGIFTGTLVARVTITPTMQAEELTVAQLFDDSQIETIELFLLEE